MKPASISEIKKSLKDLSKDELLGIINKLGTFKTENKALLTYVLFYSQTPELYTNMVKDFMVSSFEQLNQDSPFYVRKGLRKLERELNRQIKYVKNPLFEMEILTHYLTLFQTSLLKTNQKALEKIYERILQKTVKKLDGLHEDLQHDYQKLLNQLAGY